MIYRAFSVANEGCYSAYLCSSEMLSKQPRVSCQQQMQVVHHLGETLV